jgi:hypothetical protein
MEALFNETHDEPRTGSTGPAPSQARGALATIDQLLRDRSSLIDRIQDADDLASLARAMIVTIFIAGAAFGASIGAYRGGWQILFAAVKFPIVVLLTAAVCAPALTAFNKAVGRPADIRRDLALVLSSLALGALVCAAEAPFLLLAAIFSASYHTVTLALVGSCVVAGLFAIVMLARGLCWKTTRSAVSVGLALLAVMSLVGAQMSWTFRPYLVRPRTEDPPFVRAIEGDFAHAVGEALQSASGRYRRAYAPLPGEAPPEEEER